MAALAVIPFRGAVDFQHITAARLLVQPVDVLGDNGLQLPVRLHFRQRPVCDVGLDFPRIQLLAVELEEHLRIMMQTIRAEKIFR